MIKELPRVSTQQLPAAEARGPLRTTPQHAARSTGQRSSDREPVSTRSKGTTNEMGRGSKDKAAPLTKRRIKTERRCRRWQAFQRRRRLLGFDDVPQIERPRLSTQRTPIVLSLRSIEGWSAPRALKERLAADGATLECALSLSFFDCASRRFFGGTWIGRPVQVDTTGGKNTIQSCELVHWCSRVDDAACVAVIEVVACAKRDGRTVAQYGCGWTFLRLFSEDSPLTIDAAAEPDGDVLKDGSYELRPLYDGTPRKLVLAAAKLNVTRQQPKGTARRDEDLARAAGADSLKNCALVCRARRHDGLQRAWHLMGDDDVVSAQDLVPGLAPWSSHGSSSLQLPPDGRSLSGKRPMLGARKLDDSRGRSSDASMWHLVPQPKPKLATEHALHLDCLQVRVPDRKRLEQRLKRYVAFHGPELPQNGTDVAEKIVARRLCLGLHNGRALVLRRTKADGFERIDLDTNGDTLEGPADASIILNGYVKHALYAVVVALEYEIQPAQKVAQLSGKSVAPKTFKVTLGLGAYVPFDGRRLRLSTGRDAQNVAYCELELNADDTCREVSTSFVFPPSTTGEGQSAMSATATGDFDALSLQQYASGKTVRFCLSAVDGPAAKKGKDRRLQDETPDRLSDDSSDVESVADDEDLGDSGEEGARSSSEDESVVAPLRKKKKKPKKAQEESSEDDASTLSRSVVSGDSRRSELQSHRKKKSKTYASSDDESAPRRPRRKHREADVETRQDADGWRKAAPSSGSMLASLLGAPLHRADGHRAVGHPTARPPTTMTTAVGGARPQGDALSRAQRSRLARHGYPTVQLDDARALVPGDHNGAARYDLALEASDPLALHEITVQFAAFRANTPSTPLPRAVYFTFQFYTLPPTRTERLKLASRNSEDSKVDRGVQAANDASRLLVRERSDRSRRSEDEPPLILKFAVDCSTGAPNEATFFAEYLATKVLHVDVWDADSRLHVGTAAVPLDRLLRQRAPVAKVAAEYAVVAPYGLVDEGLYGAQGSGGVETVQASAGTAGNIIGHVQVVCCNYGEESSHTSREESKENEDPTPNTFLDWRRNASSDLKKTIYEGVDAKKDDPLRNSYGGSKKRRPGHRVRARPLAESSPELGHLLGSRDKRGGLLTQAAENPAPTSSADQNAVTYDEVLTMVRRFRDESKRVRYTGPLLALLEAPNLRALEAHLVRVLTRAEKKGTTLERSFSHFDRDRSGTISLVELEDALRALGCFRGQHSGGVALLLRKFDRSGDGVISLDEFLAYIRSKQNTVPVRDAQALGPVEGAALEARVKAILLKAEALGASVVDAFTDFDKDKSGSLTVQELVRAFRSLGAFADLTAKEVEAFVKLRDKDSSGTLELDEIFALMGRDYGDHLVLKLKRILDGVEARGVRVADAFAAWDADRGGTLSVTELTRGFRSLGVFQDMAQMDVASLLKRIDKDNSGDVDVKEFYVFAKWDYGEFVEARLRCILRLAEQEHGVPLDAAFREWDADGEGAISVSELREGLDALGVFKGVSDEDASTLLAKVDTDASGKLSLAEFLRFAGCEYCAVLARRLRTILLSAEGKGTTLDAAFREWDADDNGAITEAELTSGLRALGTFKDMCGDGRSDAAEIQALVCLFDKNGDGKISVRELQSFMGRDVVFAIEAKLRQIVHSSGIGAEEAFKHFDKDGDGSISRDELAAGLRELPGLEDITNSDAGGLARLYDDDGDNQISLDEFTRQLGASDSVGNAETAVLGSLRAACAKSGRCAFRAALEKRGTSVDEANLAEALNIIGALNTTSEQRRLVLDRFGGRPAVGVVVAFAQRGGVGSPDEIASDLGEPSASPKQPDITPVAHPALRDPALRAFADVLLAFEDGGADLSAAFRKLDVDKSGAVDPQQLRTGLRGLGEAFAHVTEVDAQRVVRALDKNKSGDLHLLELRRFVKMARQAREPEEEAEAAPAARKDSPELLTEKLRALLLRTEQKGTKLASVFRALDDDRSGALSVDELLSGLSELGIFDELRREDVRALVKDELDVNRDGKVDRGEFFAFCRTRDAPAKPTVTSGADSEDLEMVAQTYEFSSDPDVRAIEKKLRRAAREVAARGGDVRVLASQYDRGNTGSIVRSDFVQFLMQLGLSLVDAGKDPQDDRREAGDALRERQMRQLARVRGGAAPSRARRLLKGPMNDTNLTDEWDELALTQWYREGAKKEMVRGMLAKSMLSAVPIYPRFGTTCWFEVELTNPFGRAERFAVDVPKGEKELRVVTSAEEWQHLRRHVPVAFGSVGEGAVESDMIDGSGPPGAPPMVLLMARETVRIPFAFLSLAPPSHDLRWGRDDNKDEEGARTVPVRFVAAGGFVVAATEVTARPRACVVDRTFRFYQAGGEILKRCVRVMPPAPTPLADLGALGGWAAQAGAPRATDDRSMYVHCVGTGRGDASDVSIQWRESQDCPGAHEVLLKYARVGAFPSVGEFFVLVFRDRFCARLAEMWHVVVHSRLRADLAGVAGQAAGVELVVRGDRTPRVVRAYAAPAGGASIGDATFDPPQDFRLVPHAHNKFAVNYRAREGGASRVHVHLVDVDTHELVAAWLMTAVSSQPTITKTYDVELQLGKAATKRIPYRNPWNRPKSFGLVSSDENVLRPRDGNARVTIPPNGVEYLRLYFPAVHRRGMLQCLLYVNSEHDQSEEVFLLRLLVA